MEISRGVGTPLQLDRATKERLYGYYARVLVVVDLACDLPHSIMVERDSDGFPVDIIYENLPPKCSHCGVVGHLLANCQYVHKEYRHIHVTATPDVNNDKLAVVAMADQAIDAAINHELEKIANVVISHDDVQQINEVVVVSHDGVLPPTDIRKMDGIVSDIGDDDISPIQVPHQQTIIGPSSVLVSDKPTTNNSDLLSIAAEPVGPPPGFENTHACANETIILPSMENLVTSRAQKDLRIPLHLGLIWRNLGYLRIPLVRPLLGRILMIPT
ncbi:hypothetical protein ACFX2C_027852 [Malus domestica]